MNTTFMGTWAANLIFFAQGFFFVLPGALTPVLSEYFGESLSAVGYCLSLSVIMRIVGNFFTGRNFTSIRLHKFVTRTNIALVILLLMPLFVPNLGMFALANLSAALFLGTHFAIGNNLILYLYDDNKRTSQMAFLNFFYSAGAIVSPLVLSWFLGQNIHWAWIFAVCAVLTTGALLARKTDESAFYRPEESKSERDFESNFHIQLTYVIMLIYVIAETMYASWLPVFFIEQLHLSLADAAFTLVILWGGFAVGRFSCGFLSRTTIGYRLVVYLAGLTLLGMALLLLGLSWVDYRISTFILGLGFSGMYANILAYGNSHLDRPNVKLMTIMTCLGTAGVILGMVFASFLKEYMPTYPIMLIATALFISSMLMLRFSITKR